MLSISMLVPLSKNFKNISFIYIYSNILVGSFKEAELWWFMTVFISENVKNPVQFED